VNYRDIEVDQRFDPNFQFLKDGEYLDSPPTVGTFLIGKYKMKTDADNRCVALAGTIGTNVKCSIYDHRPTACRKYEAGEKECLNAILVQITRKGL